MRSAFVRHGHRRAGEADPDLTSAGRRQAREAGEWIRSRGFSPSLVLHTPTTRTRETAEEIARVLGGPDCRAVAGSLEGEGEWEALVALLDREAIVVGHHPTLLRLLAAFGPPPCPVPRPNFGSALLLERGADVSPWRIAAAWPGSPV